MKDKKFRWAEKEYEPKDKPIMNITENRELP